MNELSLFTGGGGGLLGTILLGFRSIGYVEIDNYCRNVVLQRIQDGILDAAPIFTDIDDFLYQGYAAAYQGVADVITAGFPCQPFSFAGKGKSEKDPRNKWPATRRAIGIIRPKIAFLENVPGLFSKKYIQRIFGDMAEIGYDCEWDIVSAADIGANHIRKRIWILAYPTEGRLQGVFTGDFQINRKAQKKRREQTDRIKGCRKNVADTEGQPERSGLCEGRQAGKRRGRFGDSGSENVPDTRQQRLSKSKQETVQRKRRRQERRTTSKCNWWATEPALGRMAHGVAHRVDRIKALGNGQVPAVVEKAWEILNDRL